MTSMDARELQREIRWLLDEKYAGRLTERAEKDIKRLEGGEHVDYLIGFVDFLGCTIDLSLRPLIPRAETEYWTEKAIEEMKRDTRKNIRVLDVFSGSGCIGVAVLKHVSNATVSFAEKESRFQKQIGINAEKNNIEPARYNSIQSDIFDDVSGKYDYILANPPYIAESRKEGVQKSVIKNEPSQALFGGEDGLKYIRGFLKEAKSRLKKDGKIYMEFDSPQLKKIKELIKENGFGKGEFFKDQFGNWRFVVIS